ncbi:replication protein RepA [Polymorphum gilvum]|nr:replication protein RepA [Polymorphum gilvum]
MKARHLLDLDAMEPLDGFAPMAPERLPEFANDNQPISRTLDKLFGTALAIELEAAKEAGALGFMARAMVQATMPHRRVAGNEFTRTNGAFSLTMLAPSKIGLPYGSIPRLVTGYLTTEAVRTKSRHIVLGSSLSRFMAELDLVPTGGRWGTIPRLRDQMTRLFACSISCTYSSGSTFGLENVNIADKATLWWTPRQPDQGTLWESTVVLSERFFSEITENPVPIDLRALRALKRSPMALDVYLWLTYRMSYVRARTAVPWGALQLQFGADYPTSDQGRRDFKKAFLRALGKVAVVYPAARLDTTTDSLVLLPSRTHVCK